MKRQSEFRTRFVPPNESNVGNSILQGLLINYE